MAVVTVDELVDLGVGEELIQEMSEQLRDSPEVLIQELSKKIPDTSILVVQGEGDKPYAGGGENDTGEFLYITTDGRNQEETHVSLEDVLDKYKYVAGECDGDSAPQKVETDNYDEIYDMTCCGIKFFESEDVTVDDFYIIPFHSAFPRVDGSGFIDNSKYPSPDEYEVTIVVEP